MRSLPLEGLRIASQLGTNLLEIGDSPLSMIVRHLANKTRRPQPFGLHYERPRNGLRAARRESIQS